MIKTSDSAASLRFTLITVSLEISQFAIHPFDRLLFMSKIEHLRAMLVSISQIHQTTTTAL